MRGRESVCLSDWVFPSQDTYIFEEALHESESDVVSRPARVRWVDVLIVSGRQFLRLVTLASVSQH